MAGHGTKSSSAERLWHATREHVSNAVIGGLLIALTGFAPEHWVAELLHALHIDSAFKSWPTGLDPRLAVVALGVAIAVGGVLFRRQKVNESSENEPASRDSEVTAHARSEVQHDRPSIAVLPFQNMSGDPDQQYFADGMVDEVITGLSRIKWLLVMSRNSSFIFKNNPAGIREVADKLGVRYVLEGGVRKSGNRVRVSAKLIDAETGIHLWAEQYDRLLEDIFTLQDEITMCVIGAIEPNLRKAEIDRIKRQRPSNLNAYDAVLRALPFVYAGMPTEAAMAVPLLETALKLEPSYSAAHAFLSWCLHFRFSRGGFREEDRLAAIRHARAAVSHGNDDATSIAVAAFVIALDEHDTTTALKLFDRALELSTSNMFALSCSAHVLAWMGRTDLAIERAQRALKLSPFDSLNYRSNIALAAGYFHRQRYQDAADVARDAIEINPTFPNSHAMLAAALAKLGRIDEAKAAARSVLECQPSFTIHGFSVIVGFEPAIFSPLRDAWRKAGLPE